MNWRTLTTWSLGLVLLILFLTLSGAFYTVQETEQVIITQFGQPVGGVVKEAGLHFKIPFIQTVHRLDKRVLWWDGPASEMPTKDKLYIVVDTYARWRIVDPLQFYLRLRDERSAQSRLNDVIGSETRNTVARHQLVELIRTTKDRTPVQDESQAAVTTLSPITAGRVALEREVTEQSKIKLAELGIELLDVSFMRINYNQAVAAKIYDRMVSERRQIADRFRSEGAGEAAKILGKRERDLKEIDSQAYQQAQTVQGKADAEAIRIYAEAFNGSPEAREFYEFQRSLETYKVALQHDTTVILNTDDGFLRYLKGAVKPAPPTPTSALPTPSPAARSEPSPPVTAAPPAL